MRIAIPCWNEIVSPVLDTAKRLLIVGIENGAITSRHEITLSDDSLRKKAECIAQHADMLVCGAISNTLLTHLVDLRIEVHPWTMGNVDCLAEIFSGGNTPGPEFMMPGCGRNRYGKCGHGRGLGRQGMHHGRCINIQKRRNDR
ncbi:MAG: hypothetical protein JXB48_16550 [Candidatus Latescibacteria bacterium]|nr:hypothetical protein [Candidatus Latescibacterota bacterium]